MFDVALGRVSAEPSLSIFFFLFRFPPLPPLPWLFSGGLPVRHDGSLADGSQSRTPLARAAGVPLISFRRMRVARAGCLGGLSELKTGPSVP